MGAARAAPFFLRDQGIDSGRSTAANSDQTGTTETPAMKRWLGAMALCAFAAGTAGAQTPVGYTEGGRTLFSVEAPDFWSIRAGGPREIVLPETGEARSVPRVLALQPTTDERVWMGFLSPPGVSTRAEARAYLREVGRFLALEAEVEAPVPRRIGGSAAEVFSGRGQRDGRNVRFSVALIDLPGNRIAIAAAVLGAGADPRFVDEINEVFASFRAR